MREAEAKVARVEALAYEFAAKPEHRYVAERIRSALAGPQWVDLFGIDPDYTEGVPVDEWLDRERGEA